MTMTEFYLLIGFYAFICIIAVISLIRDNDLNQIKNRENLTDRIYQDMQSHEKLWISKEGNNMNNSDGYHTFDELYYHRTALFACLISTCQDKTKTFKSHKHHTGDMYDGYFIAGIKTSEGWCTYHCQEKWWPLFDCPELEYAPEWDNSTPSDCIHRLMHDYLPKQEVNGESK